MIDITLEVLDAREIALAVVDGTSIKLELESPFYDGGGIPYDGDYTIRPQPWTEIVLPTAAKRMRDDLTVLRIPFAQVSNEYGGLTATIGD